MSDLGKVVQKLSETNLRLGRLEEQNAESNTAASIIAASLPEVLNDRSIASNREDFDKDQRITETDDNVRENTKTLAAKIDTTNLILKDKPKDIDPNFIGPLSKPEPKPDIDTGSDEEDEKDRTKALKKVFSPLTKSFDKVSKSITGFFGGMAKTVTGGAELFLKGIITASVLGLIIKFLQSDYFKEFLSEENLNKLSDFFTNLGFYMNQLFDYLADSTNPSSIAYAIAIGAGIFLAGGLISKIIGGVAGTYAFIKSLGTLFGVGGALSATSTAAGATSATASATAVKGLGIAGILKGLGIAALIAALVKGTYEGMKTAQKSYMEGNSFGKIIADGIGSFLTLGFFPNFAKSISDFLVPTAKSKLSNLEKELAGLESGTGDVMKYDTATRGLKGISRETEIKRVQKAIAEQKKLAGIEEKEKNETAMLRKAEKEYNTNLNKFLDEENKKLIKEGKSGFIDPQGMGHDFKKMEQLTKQFGVSPMTKKDIAETKASNLKEIKEKIQTNSAFAMIGAGNPEFEKRITGLSQSDLTNESLRDKRMEIINNIVNSNQIDNSKSENKTIMAKPVTPSIQEQYLYSGY